MTYYEFLGVSFSATQEEIKNAYRRMAKKYHPDINLQADALIMMQQINEAYETLSDLEKRKAYDLKIKGTTDNRQENEAYKSYTKTREESEVDLDDYLKDYLFKRRNLDILFEFYTYKKAATSLLYYAFSRPTLKDIAEEEALLLNIKDVLNQLLSDYSNPITVLEYFFNEFIKTFTQVAFNEQVHVKDYELQIKLDFIKNEINQYLEKYKQDYTDDISLWLQSKIYELNAKEHLFQLSEEITLYLTEYLQQLSKKFLRKRNNGLTL